jgi:hypothetical protein
MLSEHVSLAVAALQQVDEPAREGISGRPDQWPVR